jgi:hypothetical protein
VSATDEHELIVAMVARYMREQGYELVALECSLSWLFGNSFRLPPSIVAHRPDVLGIRKEAPFVCIGEGKTRNDIRSPRTRHQLRDFAAATIGQECVNCDVIVGIPGDCNRMLGRLLFSLGIPTGRIKVIPVPRPLLRNREQQ